MVPVNKIEQGLASYLDAELMPSLPSSGIQKVLVGTAMSIMIKKSSTIVEELKSNSFVKMLGIIDDRGNVDIETLRTELKKNMPEDGVKIEIPVVGVMTFTKDDIDTLYDHIMKSNY